MLEDDKQKDNNVSNKTAVHWEEQPKKSSSRDKQAKKTSLKTMTVPGAVVQIFLNAAEINTQQNIETIGFLCGTTEPVSFANYLVLLKFYNEILFSLTFFMLTRI